MNFFSIMKLRNFNNFFDKKNNPNFKYKQEKNLDFFEA